MACLCGDTAQKYKETLEDVLKYLTEWARVFESQGITEIAEDMSRKAAEIRAAARNA